MAKAKAQGHEDVLSKAGGRWAVLGRVQESLQSRPDVLVPLFIGREVEDVSDNLVPLTSLWM